jgi:hemoglobin-like flavoprotein
MTPRQIELVQESFRAVEPILDQATKIFYDRLFEMDPTLKQMFRRPGEEQARMLGQALTLVVKSIDKPEKIRTGVEALGRRHLDYGVRKEMYVTVGVALLWTLEKGLGDAFTPEVRDAWLAAYTWLATAMQNAASPLEAQAMPQAQAHAAAGA